MGAANSKCGIGARYIIYGDYVGIVLAALHEVYIFVNGSDHGEDEAKLGKSFQMCGRSMRRAVYLRVIIHDK